MDVFTIPSWFLPAALILFLFNIFLYALRSTRSWSSMGMGKLPPTPPKLPIIGNLHQLLGKHQHQALWQLSQTYGPLMLLHFGSKPYLIVSSSAVANQILKTHDRFFCTRPVYQGTKRLTYDYLDIAFSPYDNHWKEMRKVFVSELLGQKRAGLFNAVTEKEIEGLVRSLSLLPSGTVVNLDEKLLALVFGVNCKVAFGKSYREEPFRGESLKDMLDEAKNMLGGSTGDHFPIIGRILDKLSGWTGRLDKCFSNLDGYVQMVLDEHLNHAGAEISEHEKDFVHALIDLSSKENTTRLTKEDIKALIMDVLTGGTDTIKVAPGHNATGTQKEKIKTLASKHIFIIGGIGVTAFLGEIEKLSREPVEVEVHYAVRSRNDAAYLSRLPLDKTTIYAKDQGQRLILSQIIPEPTVDKGRRPIVYCCGPTSLMNACRNLTTDSGYPKANVHFEEFGDATTGTGDPFEVEIKSTGQTVQVPREKSLLQVLSDAGFEIESSCLVGNCGTCMVDYYKGDVDHKGVALDEEQKKGYMLSCVSRGKGKIVI